jgi:RNA polymerase sigma factor (sigma-70 family)
VTPHDLFNAHQYLVTCTLRRHYNPPPPRIDPDDLESAGLLGLWHAAQRYDPAKGTKFRTFAIACIGFAMREHLRNAAWAPRRAYLSHAPVPELVSSDILLDDSDERIVDQIPSTAPTPEEILFPPDTRNVKNRRIAARLLRALPKKERRLVWLSLGWGLPGYEIAARVGLSVSHTNKCLTAARAAAREVAAGW